MNNNKILNTACGQIQQSLYSIEYMDLDSAVDQLLMAVHLLDELKKERKTNTNAASSAR